MDCPGRALFVAASLGVGLGLVVGGPAMQSIVPSMIRTGEMAAAMALSSVPMTVARAGGPAVGAAVATQLGPAAAFGMAAAANGLYALIVLALRLPRGPAYDRDTDFSVRAAFHHLRSDAPLVVLLAGIAAVGAGVDPSVTLAPALAHEFGGGPTLVGWLATCFGLGAGIGFLLFAPLHGFFGLERLSSGGLWLIAGGLGIAAVSWAPAVALLGFAASGVGMTLAFTSITTQIQNRSPDSLRGRIMALWLVGFLGVRPFAAGLTGILADAASVSAALAVTSFIVAGAAYLCRPSRLVTHWGT